MGGVLSSAFPSKIEAPTRRVFKFMIERVLGKYIKLADDKFSAEDLGVSLANGQGYLRNLSLNEAVSKPRTETSWLIGDSHTHG